MPPTRPTSFFSRRARALVGVLVLHGACAKVPVESPTRTQPSAHSAELAQPHANAAPEEGDEPVSQAQRQAKIPYTRFHMPIEGAPQHGPADAAVTIVMFSDFECPFCRSGYDTLKALESEFPQQIRLVYRAFPISRHPNAMMAALLAASAHARGVFWPFHQRLFSGEPLSPERLWRDVEALGLPRQEIAREIEELRYGPTLSQDLRLAKKMDVTSTPTFFVNGRPVAGSLPLAAFRHLVEQEIRVAQHVQARGVKPADVYQRLIEHGFGGVDAGESQPGELDGDRVYPVPIADSPQVGPSDAPVTMVLFTDFECPYCVRGNEVVDRLRARYPQQLRLVFKHLPLPFHRVGHAAARLAVVAHRHQKFWEFHDTVMHQRGRLDGPALTEIAERLRLPAKEVDAALNDSDHEAAKRVSQDLDLAQMLGVSGTPSYFINGRPITGARDELEFRLVIAEELQRVQTLVSKGMPPSQVYEHLLQSGQTTATP